MIQRRPLRVRRPGPLPLSVRLDLDRLYRLGFVPVWGWPELSRRGLITDDWCAVIDVPFNADRTKAVFGRPSLLGHARLAVRARRAQEPA